MISWFRVRVRVRVLIDSIMSKFIQVEERERKSDRCVNLYVNVFLKKRVLT